MALAIVRRSPNSCERSFRYGVSPHPAQAPENSNRGSRNWVPRTVPKSTRVRSTGGSCSKKAMFCRSAATSGSRPSRLIALRPGSSRGRDRTRLDAQPASGAVLDVHLQCEAGVWKPGAVERGRTEPRGGAVEAAGVVIARANHAVGTDEAAVTALDAELRIPDRDEIRDVALLVLGRAARICAVDRQAR